MSFPIQLGDQASFFSKYRIDPKRFSACGLKWDELITIANDHCAQYSVLLPVANYVSERLRILPDVHSLRIRIKDPEHLIEKVIRKVLEHQRPITVDNYQDEITDLIGIRALHLFKDQWKPIHDFVTPTWDTHEKPTAYIRKGDSEKLVELLAASGCEVKPHDFGYRSVHYLLKVQPEKRVYIIELQVRTVFEEGWSEIDHLIRYPNQSKDQRLEEFLVLFNTLAGNADEMGSFIKNLSSSLHLDAIRAKEIEQQLREKEKGLEEAGTQLKEAVARLKIKQKEKTDLETRINELTEQRHAAKDIRYKPSEFLTTLNTFGTSSSTGMAFATDWAGAKEFAASNWGTKKLCSECMKPYLDHSVIIGKSVCNDCRTKK